MRCSIMKLRLGTILLVTLSLVFVKSEKIQNTLREGEEGENEQINENGSQLSMETSEGTDDKNSELIMKRLQKMPTDKLKNILRIINKQNDEQPETDADNVSKPNDEGDGGDKKESLNTIKEEFVANKERPEKISFHKISSFQQNPEKGAVPDGEGKNDQDIEKEREVLSSSQDRTQTGSLRQLKKLQPVTNILIHSFEGDVDDRDFGASLRGTSKGENIAKLSTNGAEIDTGNNDIFAGTEERLPQGKGALMETQESPMKLSRLVSKLEKIDTDVESEAIKPEETHIDHSVTNSRSSDGGKTSQFQLKTNNQNTGVITSMRPIKLLPIVGQRNPFRHVIKERLPDKVIEEINEAMIERVQNSGDRRATNNNQEQSKDTRDDNSANEGAIGKMLNTNTTEDAGNKRVTKSQFAFSYDPDSPIGPEMWKVLHTDWTCQGRKQSPIDIKTDSVANDTICKNIVIRVEPDGRPISGILRNNGHAPTFSLTNSATVRLMGATLPNDYFLKQLHFHFGCENSRGSEHKIDGQSYPMELHLVFWDKKTFDSFAQAAKSDRGIAVVAILFQRSFVPVSQVRNTPVTQLLQVLKKIPNEGDFVQISEIFDFRLEKLIPNVMNTLQADRFFTYEGSLTTPGCYESVTWIVLNSHPVITDDQLEMFRKLKSAKVNSEGTMCDNYRPIQKSYGRRIYSNII